MSKKVISLSIDTNIDSVIKDLEKYKQDFLKRVNVFRSKVAEKIADLSQTGFNSSGVDDLLLGGTRQAQVSVSVSDNGKMTLVIASGEDAVWVEFGAGVYHNTGVGTSPNPYGKETGLTIGSYGKNGSKNVWGFYEKPGDPTTLQLTHGTEATMPMYKAVQTIIPQIVSIAREVFQ
jgi:hypothetical protein